MMRYLRATLSFVRLLALRRRICMIRAAPPLVSAARAVRNPAWVRWGLKRCAIWVKRARALSWRPINTELQCRVDQTVHRRRDTVQAAKFDHLASEPWQFELIAGQQIVAH